MSHSTLHIPGEVQRVRPFTTDNVNTSCCEQGNVKILILQGQGGHTNAKGRLGTSSGELWKPDSVCLTLSLFVDLFFSADQIKLGMSSGFQLKLM